MAPGRAPWRARTTRSATCPLFPKLNSLVVHTDTLRGARRRISEVGCARAAYAARDWAVETRRSDAQLADALCQEGGTVVHDPDAGSAVVCGTRPPR